MTAAPIITPRLLTDKQAADYCSLPLKTFVGLGVARVRLGSKVRFDRFALDRYLNELSGVVAPETPVLPPADNDDPDAALARFKSSRSDAPASRP